MAETTTSCARLLTRALCRVLSVVSSTDLWTASVIPRRVASSGRTRKDTSFIVWHFNRIRCSTAIPPFATRRVPRNHVDGSQMPSVKKRQGMRRTESPRVWHTASSTTRPPRCESCAKTHRRIRRHPSSRVGSTEEEQKIEWRRVTRRRLLRDARQENAFRERRRGRTCVSTGSQRRDE